ncbi:hypothetical protein N9R79_03220 [Vibrio sp.]|nr:hypothetical protein [Vibrio sp.]
MKSPYLSLLTTSILMGISGHTMAEALTEITLSQTQQDEAAIIAAQPDSLALVRESIETLDNPSVEAITVGANANPSNVKRVESIINEQDWDFLFPERAPEYTYLNFLKAIGKYPAFCGDYTDGRNAEAICRKSLATMFAHFAQETGGHNSYSAIPEWRQALVYLREIGWTEEASGGYGVCSTSIWQGQAYPCGTNADGTYKSYFGRGAKQLSYNYNYGPFSQSIYGNVEKLLDEPELVADTWLNLASAVFFYLYPQPPKPSMLHVIDGTWQPNEQDRAAGLIPGFGVTTQIINGGIECGGSAEHKQSQNRIDYYKEFANHLNVPIPANEVLGCASMQQFNSDGAGALDIYWEMDWGWTPDTPDGRTYKCQLVSYQGPFSAFNEGDYQRCVEDKFDVTVVDNNEGPINQLPQAETGQDITVNADNSVTTVLDASASTDSDGTVVRYAWQQIDSTGIGVSIASADQAQTAITIPALSNDRVFTFRVTIEDDKGATDSDTMRVTANVTQSNNVAPTASLNAQTSTEEGSFVQVTSTVTDPDDDTHSYTWSVSPSVNFTAANDNQSISFVAPEVEVDTPYSVQLTVQDSASNSTTAATTVTVINITEGPDTGEGEYSAYQEGANYQAGDKVTHQGDDYECKPWPYSGWCSGAAWAYEPGAGTSWESAWIKL